MSQTLSRGQAAALGLVVLAALVVGGYGVARIAGKQGLWADTFDVAVGFPEAHDVTAGTPVRVRGVDAGQVVAVEYPADDAPGSNVVLRLRLDRKFADRLYADASAQVHATGLLGAKVIAVSPGSTSAGPLTTGELRGTPAADLTQAAARLEAAATEAEALLKDVRAGKGTVGKLLTDDELHRDLAGLAADVRAASADARSFLKRADGAVGTVESEMAAVRGLVQDGRDAVRSVKQGTDAVQKMPGVRWYVEDATALLVRPAHARERMTYDAADLFQPGTAVLSDGGRGHLNAVAGWLIGQKANTKGEVVVVSYADPGGLKDATPAAAGELTRKQSEVVAEYLKAAGAHKLGWWSRRTITPLGMGVNPPPVAEKEPLPPGNVQVLLFTPQ